MAVYPFLNHLHSAIRWFLLSGLLVSLYTAISCINGKKGLTSGGKLFSRLTVYLAHSQLLVGIALYMISPKVIFRASAMSSPILRFFLVEHITAMVASIALITAGYSMMKKAADPVRSVKTLFWFYLAALVVILAMIPWPFLSFGGHWI
jgi:hypothetical protein